MRERLDEIDPKQFRSAFKRAFSMLQRNKVLEEYVYMNDSYLVSIDGTGQFSSSKVHCNNCCIKESKDGTKSYYHQMLGAALVHPNKKQVIPLAPEPILKQDGTDKNGSERGSCKRLLADLRREHPHLKIIVVEDGLSSNGPHIRTLQDLDMRYILGAKPGDHKFLFDWVNSSDQTKHSFVDKDGIKHSFSFVNKVPLNDANFELEVNFLEYWEEDKKGKIGHYSWVTDIPITKENAYKIMRGGRARWKIENETFNTLKNQGYNFEHNYGHGKVNLCTNMTMMMLLAFLIDQAQLLCCRYFQSLRKCGTYKSLWETLRVVLKFFEIESWEKFYEIMVVKMCPLTLTG